MPYALKNTKIPTQTFAHKDNVTTVPFENGANDTPCCFKINIGYITMMGRALQ